MSKHVYAEEYDALKCRQVCPVSTSISKVMQLVMDNDTIKG